MTKTVFRTKKIKDSKNTSERRVLKHGNRKQSANKVTRYQTNKFKKRTMPKRGGRKISGSKVKTDNALRIIPLGGQEEVGRNMTIFEYKNDIVIIDMGLQFPEEDMPGIDYIIPNTEYLRGREKNIKGVIFTHGHLDHIGAAPHLLEKLGWPLVVASKLTAHMIRARQEDLKKGTSKNIKTKEVTSFNYEIKLGGFKVKFFPVTHSIMDAMGIILQTPVATVIHPGDWKLEKSGPRKSFDYKKLSRLKKPTVLMLESLGVSYKKDPVPEQEMYHNIEELVKEAPGRVIISTFGSNVERVKVILEMAEKYGRSVAVDGFSMKSNIEIAKKLGYIKFNLKNLIDLKQAVELPDKKIIIICTGAQGEENAALPRIANGEHRFIKIKKQDTIIFSSSVIPGNERTIQKLKDLIYRQSDHVIHSDILDVHSGGHATAKDLKQVISDVKSTYFMPVYANHYMLKEAANVARGLNYKDDKIFIADNGSVVEIRKRGAKMLAKKVDSNPVFVDGLGVSNLQNVVLRDRQILAEDGMVVVIATVSKKGVLVHSPDIISRGFVYLKENKELIGEVRKKVRRIVQSQKKNGPVQDDYLKNKLRNDLGQYLFSKTGKRPMVLPVVIEV